jgi:hypothetical protein
MPDQPGGAAEPADPGADDDDIKGHAAFLSGPENHSFCIPLKAFKTSIRSLLS